MRNLTVLVLLVVASRGAFADTPDPAAANLAKLSKAASCENKTSPWRPWCIATDWAKGTAAALPTNKVLVGMTIELEDGKDISDALTHKVTFTALAIDKAGKVKLTMIKPSNAAEEKDTLEAVFNTSAVFKGTSRPAKLPKGLVDYLKTLQAAYKPTKGTSEWTWEGVSSTRARKVGEFWVVIETPKQGATGVFATILTDAWE